MNQQNNTTIIAVEEVKVREKALADLSLTIEQAEATKAGIVGGSFAASGEFPSIISLQRRTS